MAAAHRLDALEPIAAALDSGGALASGNAGAGLSTGFERTLEAYRRQVDDPTLSTSADSYGSLAALLADRPAWENRFLVIDGISTIGSSWRRRTPIRAEAQATRAHGVPQGKLEHLDRRGQHRFYRRRERRIQGYRRRSSRRGGGFEAAFRAFRAMGHFGADVAAIARDPALRSKPAGFLEVILYASFWALAFHRVAHFLAALRLPFVPRLLSQLARLLTGIEIHPGACFDQGSTACPERFAASMASRMPS